MAMRINSIGSLLLAVSLAACGQHAPTATTPPGAAETMIAERVAATLTSAVPLPGELPTSAPTTAPTAIAPPPTALAAVTAGPVPTAVVPTSQFFTDAVYELADERLISGYAVRIWQNASPSADPLGFDRLATIAQAGHLPVQVEFFSELDPLTGSDITGDGTPDVIIKTYSGGAHCCFSTVVYSLGERLDKLLETQASNCGGEFRDLDHDGIAEFITCDDRFAYTYCPFAASPVVTAVLAYHAGQGYVAASPQFPELYDTDIQQATALAEAAQPGALGEWDVTTKCAVLPLVLAYLYSGQTEQAWSALERLYAFPDAQAFREEIETTVTSSPLYVAP